MTSAMTQRRVARALRPGGPEVIKVESESIGPPGPGEVLIRVEAAGLNHVEGLIRSDNYVVRLPFPHSVGGEGSGSIVAVGSDVKLDIGTRVCWATILGSCATYLIAPASMVVPVREPLSFEMLHA